MIRNDGNYMLQACGNCKYGRLCPILDNYDFSVCGENEYFVNNEE